MNKYEITLLTSEDLKEAPVKKEIEELDGKILSTSVLGEKQLAYAVKKQTTGIYTTVIFEMEGEKVLELNKKLVLKPEILRQLIIIHKENKPAPAKAVPAEELALKAEPETVEKVEKIAPTSDESESRPESVGKEKTEKVEPFDIAQDKEKPEKKPEKAAPKVTKKVPAKPEIKSQKVQEKIQEEISADDRLKALDKKLDELLKE